MFYRRTKNLFFAR